MNICFIYQNLSITQRKKREKGGERGGALSHYSIVAVIVPALEIRTIVTFWSAVS